MLFQSVGVLDAVDAEAAEVVAQFAPGGEGPGASPEVERQRMDTADTGLSVFTGIGKQNDAALLCGSVERVELAAQLGRRLVARRVEQDVVDVLAQVCGEDGFDLAQRAVGRLGQLDAAPGFHHAGA